MSEPGLRRGEIRTAPPVAKLFMSEPPLLDRCEGDVRCGTGRWQCRSTRESARGAAMDLPRPNAEQLGPSPVVHGTIIEQFLRMPPILWLQPFRLSIDARGEFTGGCPLRSGSDRIAVLLRNDAMGH